MKKIAFFLFFLQLAFAQFYIAKPEVLTGNTAVEISARCLGDPEIKVTENMSMIYLEVANKTKYPFRIEPHYNSVLLDQNNWRYYQKKVSSKNKFVPGFIQPGQVRRGFLYFQGFRQDKNEKFKLLLKNMKLYDGRSNNYDLTWNFKQTTAAPLQNFPLDVPAGDTDLPAGTLRDLDYGTQLQIAEAGPEDIDKLKFKIDLPDKAHRDENIQFSLYAPTVVDVASVTVLIGVGNYVDLSKGPNGTFTGYFRVPELYELRSYIVSFYIQFPDGRKTVRQKTIDIIPY